MDIVDFAVLAKDANDVAFGEVEREGADVDPGGGRVFGVPGGGGVG